MAKGGLDYFPLNCQLDEKFELIEAQFGLMGFSVIVKLLQRIYGEHGYYCEWTNEVAMIFAKRIGVSDKDVNQIVDASIRRGMFSEELFHKFEILTSKGIQKRYLEAVSRRKEVELKNEYLLLELGDLKKNVYISNKSVYINAENADIFQQRRVKESKGKESKGEERRVEKSKRGTLSPFGKFKNVFLDNEEYQEIKDAFQSPDKLINRLSSYKEKFSKEYNNDYVVLLEWAQKDGDRRIPEEETETRIEGIPMPPEFKEKLKSIFKEV